MSFGLDRRRKVARTEIAGASRRPVSSVMGSSAAAATAVCCLLYGADAAAASGNPTAYVRSDGIESILHVRSNLDIEEYYLPTNIRADYSWGDPTALAHGNSAAGRPSGYVRADGTNAIVYIDNLGHVWEVSLSNGWNGTDLTKKYGGAPAAGNPLGYVRADGKSAVIYRDSTGDIWELSLTNDWAVKDLTATWGGTKAGGDPRGYARSDGTTSVVYRGTDNYIHELYLNQGASGWLTGTLSAAGDAAGDPTGYVRGDGANAVVYRSTDSHIHEIVLNGGWSTADLSGIYGAPNAAGDPSAYKRWDNNTSSVVYRTTGNYVEELRLDSSGWHTGDLALTGLPAVNSDPVGFVVSSSTGYEKNAVVFSGADGNIYEVFLSNDVGTKDWVWWNVTASNGYGAPAAVVHQDPTVSSILAQAFSLYPMTPGLVAAVVINDTVRFATAGKRRFTDTTNTLQETDQFDLASVSKVFAGATLTRNVDVGNASWDQTLADVPFNWTNPHPEYLGATMAELSAHAAGMWYNTGANTCGWCTPDNMDPTCIECRANGITGTPAASDDYVSTGDTVTLRRLLYTNDAMQDQPLFLPGQGELYGGGFISSIAMLEQRVGSDYETLLRNWIFDPLRLNHTGTLSNVWPHTWAATVDNLTVPPVPQQPVDTHFSLRLPVGGLSASIEDMGRFAYALLYSPQTPWRLWSDSTQQGVATTVGRSEWSPLGFARDMNDSAGGVDMWKTGSNGAQEALLTVWPDRKVAFAVMTNYCCQPGGAEGVADWVLNELKAAIVSSYGAPPASFPHMNAPTYLATNTTATSTDSGSAASYAFDGRYSSQWKAPEGTTSATLRVNLAKPVTVGHVLIDEGEDPYVDTPAVTQPMTSDQVKAFRVTSFQVVLGNGTKTWTATSGTSIGVEKVIPVGPYTGVTSARLIMNSVNGPAIKEFHLLP